jgi:hypothetical protein
MNLAHQLVWISLLILAGACRGTGGAAPTFDDPTFDSTSARARLSGRYEVRWEPPLLVGEAEGLVVRLMETVNVVKRTKIEAAIEFDNRGERTLYVDLDQLRVVFDGQEYSAKGRWTTNRQVVRPKQARRLTIWFELPRAALHGVYDVELKKLLVESSGRPEPLGDGLRFKLAVAGDR